MKTENIIIYRDRLTKKIISYSFTNIDSLELINRVHAFNSEREREKIAEAAFSEDLKALIEIAEKNKKIKKNDLIEIERAIDNLQNELYLLRESVE